jgi:hypothetical protein
MKPSEAPGACKHIDNHLCSLDEQARVWRYECFECESKWTLPVTDEDVPLVTALRGGRPMIAAVR